MTKPTLSTATKEAIGKKVLAAMKASGFSSRAKYATSIGINSSDFSNIERENWKRNEKLLSVDKWLRIARTVGFEFGEAQKWSTAQTVTFSYIAEQLGKCQHQSLAGILCDEAGIGKTYAAREYAATHRNAYYINGGAHASRSRFVRELAKSMGLDNTGTTEEVLQLVVYYMKSLEAPLIIIDEGGDLHNSTYLVLKRLYNELELHCGFYMLGAPDLKKRIDASIRLRRNGFEEVYSRFGGRFTKVVPVEMKERAAFLRNEKAAICKANNLTDDTELNRILSNPGDMRQVRIQVLKTRLAVAA